jgi:hypothetical protein
MKSGFSRRRFLAGSVMASAGLSPLMSALAAGEDGGSSTRESKQVAPCSKGTVPTGKIGDVTVSRLISGGNLLSGWCHQRDLLFVRNIAAAYLTERKQHDTLQMIEEAGVNAIVIDLMQQDILNKYRKERGGKIQAIVSVREDWGDWETPHLDKLMAQTMRIIDKGADLLYLHGSYCDRVVQAAMEKGRTGNLEVLGKALDLIRGQGYSAGLGAHALEVLKEGKKQGIKPDFYVKTFHHDRYWSATPKERRKPFCVDGPPSLDHNEFHDNIFCLDAEGTSEFMQGETVPWIGFKVLAAGAIKPESGFRFAFENGVDFIAVGMFDFEVAEDLRILHKTLDGLQRKRPWRA